MQAALQALFSNVVLPACAVGFLAAVSMLWLEHMARD